MAGRLNNIVYAFLLTKQNCLCSQPNVSWSYSVEASTSDSELLGFPVTQVRLYVHPTFQTLVYTSTDMTTAWYDLSISSYFFFPRLRTWMRGRALYLPFLPLILLLLPILVRDICPGCSESVIVDLFTREHTLRSAVHVQ